MAIDFPACSVPHIRKSTSRDSVTLLHRHRYVYGPLGPFYNYFITIL